MNATALRKISTELQDFKDAWARKEFRLNGHFNIAVVDDDSSFLNIVGAFLKNVEGINLLKFKDEFEFIRNLKEEIPDLLILDINLEYINGIKVAEIIESVPGAQMPILFVSHYNFLERDIKSRLCSNTVSYLQKPLKKEALILKLENILGS